MQEAKAKSGDDRSDDDDDGGRSPSPKRSMVPQQARRSNRYQSINQSITLAKPYSSLPALGRVCFMVTSILCLSERVTFAEEPKAIKPRRRTTGGQEVRTVLE